MGINNTPGSHVSRQHPRGSAELTGAWWITLKTLVHMEPLIISTCLYFMDMVGHQLINNFMPCYKKFNHAHTLFTQCHIADRME
jgi:hypothetical protein